MRNAILLATILKKKGNSAEQSWLNMVIIFALFLMQSLMGGTPFGGAASLSHFGSIFLGLTLINITLVFPSYFEIPTRYEILQ